MAPPTSSVMNRIRMFEQQACSNGTSSHAEGKVRGGRPWQQNRDKTTGTTPKPTPVVESQPKTRTSQRTRTNSPSIPSRIHPHKVDESKPEKVRTSPRTRSSSPSVSVRVHQFKGDESQQEHRTTPQRTRNPSISITERVQMYKADVEKRQDSPTESTRGTPTTVSTRSCTPEKESVREPTPSHSNAISTLRTLSSPSRPRTTNIIPSSPKLTPPSPTYARMIPPNKTTSSVSPGHGRMSPRQRMSPRAVAVSRYREAALSEITATKDNVMRKENTSKCRKDLEGSQKHKMEHVSENISGSSSKSETAIAANKMPSQDGERVADSLPEMLGNQIGQETPSQTQRVHVTDESMAKKENEDDGECTQTLPVATTPPKPTQNTDSGVHSDGGEENSVGPTVRDEAEDHKVKVDWPCPDNEKTEHASKDGVKDPPGISSRASTATGGPEPVGLVQCDVGRTENLHNKSEDPTADSHICPSSKPEVARTSRAKASPLIRGRSRRMALMRNSSKSTGRATPSRMETRFRESEKVDKEVKVELHKTGELKGVQANSTIVMNCTAGTKLKQNLESASVIIQEEKASSVGSASSSQRSSLSTSELSSIAMRAFEASKRQTTSRKAKMLKGAKLHVSRSREQPFDDNDDISTLDSISTSETRTSKEPAQLPTRTESSTWGSAQSVDSGADDNSTTNSNMTLRSRSTTRSARLLTLNSMGQTARPRGPPRHIVADDDTVASDTTYQTHQSRASTRSARLSNMSQFSRRHRSPSPVFGIGNNSDAPNSDVTPSMSNARTEKQRAQQTLTNTRSRSPVPLHPPKSTGTSSEMRSHSSPKRAPMPPPGVHIKEQKKSVETLRSRQAAINRPVHGARGRRSTRMAMLSGHANRAESPAPANKEQESATSSVTQGRGDQKGTSSEVREMAKGIPPPSADQPKQSESVVQRSGASDPTCYSSLKHSATEAAEIDHDGSRDQNQSRHTDKPSNQKETTAPQKNLATTSPEARKFRSIGSAFKNASNPVARTVVSDPELKSAAVAPLRTAGTEDSFKATMSSEIENVIKPDLSCSGKLMRETLQHDVSSLSPSHTTDLRASHHESNADSRKAQAVAHSNTNEICQFVKEQSEIEDEDDSKRHKSVSSNATTLKRTKSVERGKVTQEYSTIQENVSGVDEMAQNTGSSARSDDQTKCIEETQTADSSKDRRQITSENSCGVSSKKTSIETEDRTSTNRRGVSETEEEAVEEKRNATRATDSKYDITNSNSITVPTKIKSNEGEDAANAKLPQRLLENNGIVSSHRTGESQKEVVVHDDETHTAVRLTKSDQKFSCSEQKDQTLSSDDASSRSASSSSHQSIDTTSRGSEHSLASDHAEFASGVLDEPTSSISHDMSDSISRLASADESDVIESLQGTGTKSSASSDDEFQRSHISTRSGAHHVTIGSSGFIQEVEGHIGSEYVAMAVDENSMLSSQRFRRSRSKGAIVADFSPAKSDMRSSGSSAGNISILSENSRQDKSDIVEYNAKEGRSLPSTSSQSNALDFQNSPSDAARYDSSTRQTPLDWRQENYSTKQNKEVNDVVLKALSPMSWAQRRDEHRGGPSGGASALPVEDTEDIFSGLEDQSDFHTDCENNFHDMGTQFRNPSSVDDEFTGGLISHDHIIEAYRPETSSKYVDRRIMFPVTAPPPPPPRSDSDDPAGAILDGSAMMDSVNSDITSSVLGGEPANWEQSELTRRNQSNIIQEELPDEVEEENESLPAKTNKKREDRRTLKTPPRQRKNSNKNVVDGVFPNDNQLLDAGSSTPPQEKNSLFMNFGWGVIESFANGLCRAPGQDLIATQSMEDEDDELAANESFVDDDNVTEVASIAGSNASQTVTTMHTVGSVTSAASATLSDQERQVWDDWERRDSQSKSAKTTTASLTKNHRLTSSQKDREELKSEKRMDAQEKLLTYVSSALQAPVPEAPSSEEDVKEEAPADPPSALCSCPSKENIASPQSESSLGRETTTASPYQTKVLSTQNDSDRELSFNQRRVLEHFTSKMKNQGLQVLKLSRDKKWQLRFLTVSKEAMWLSSEGCGSGDRGQCPKGVLWLKKFNTKSRDHSISSIDKQGRGGVLALQLKKVSAAGRGIPQFPVSRKYQEKFSKCAAVNVTYSTGESFRSVVFLCRNTDEAHFLCAGLRVVIDILQRDQPSQGLVAV